MARELLASDDFNRSGGLGANWTNLNTDRGVVQITDDTHVEGTTDQQPAARWSGAGDFSPDQYAKATIFNLAFIGPSYWGGVIVRASADTESARDYYFLIVEWNGGGPNYTTRLGKVVNGTVTTLTTGSFPWSNGDTIELEVEGSALRAFRNGVEIEALATTDEDIADGRPGILASLVTSLDDWEAGNVVLAQALELEHTPGAIEIVGQVHTMAFPTKISMAEVIRRRSDGEPIASRNDLEYAFWLKSDWTGNIDGTLPAPVVQGNDGETDSEGNWVEIDTTGVLSYGAELIGGVRVPGGSEEDDLYDLNEFTVT